MNAYEKENLVKRAPKEQLIAVMQGQSDAFPQWMALAELNMRREMGVATDGLKAQQQLAQGKQTVKDRKMAEMLPEEQGIGQLPAQNMEALAAAEGGIMGYADGGYVEHFDRGGRVPNWEDVLAAEQQWKDAQTPWYMPTPASDPAVGAQARYKQVMAAYEGKKPLDFLAPLPAAPAAAPSPTAAPDATSANIKKKIDEAPNRVKDALKTAAQPATPVADPTKEEKANLTDKYKSSTELYDYISEKFKGQLDPIKEQLQRDRDEYKNMKSENVGLALLGAAGALLKPGRSTASAIGEGLGTLAEYGTKFQPQMLAARQGISAGEIGLAQAEAQAARGNFAMAMGAQDKEDLMKLERAKLAEQERYHTGYLGALNARNAAIGGGGGMNQKLYAQTYNNANKAWEKFVAGKGGSLYKPKPGEQEAFIKNYMQQSLPGLNLAGASSGYTGGPNIIRGGKPDPEDLMG